ncbi:MAG: class I SAM-dependent methyltransferase [Candidatus Omnitrophica bacterium]|nr:class I SAM-dependent methyltransferase [Candidatus Omnitrophota bacterium]
MRQEPPASSLQPPAPAAVRRRTDCRLCGSRDLQQVMSLGATPLANAFVSAADRKTPQARFPLDVHLCGGCGHVQLLDVVDPEVLFRDYVYVSSTSPVFVDHFRRYAEAMLALTGMPAGSRIVEIGSNDGALLGFFQAAGMRVLGIDPARRIAERATAGGIPTLPEFFTPALAKRLRTEGGEAALVAANNVFAHADDLHAIAEGVAQLLAPDGLFVFEVSYLLDVVEKTLFDTIYHEHLSYHTVKPLASFFERHGMELIDAIRIDSHGGSLRGIAKRRPPRRWSAAGRGGGRFPRQPGVDRLISEEARLGLHGPEAFRAFFRDIQSRKAELTQLLRRLKGEGKRIAGFGAPAKATTLMFHFGLGPETLDYVIDDSPLKQGLYTPGHHLPVVPSSCLYEASRRPDEVLILAWNFAEPIMQAHRKFLDAGGHFIVPLPRVEVR